MSTAGYLVAYDPVAFESEWLAHREVPLSTIQQEIRSRSTPERWHGETQEAVESNDREMLLDLLFTVTCVGQEPDELVIGRYVTLESFARQLTVVDPAGGLTAMVKEWCALPIQLRSKEDEPLIPAPRDLLQRIWRRAQEARPHLKAMDASAVSNARLALKVDDDEYAALALTWLGWLVEHTQLSVAYAYEGHTSVPLAPLPPPSVEQMKAALREQDLPLWDHYYEKTQPDGSEVGAFMWVKDVGDGNLRMHAELTVEGNRVHVVWKAVSTWRRFLTGDKEPVPTRSGQGACGEPGCRWCEAARVAAEVQTPR